MKRSNCWIAGLALLGTMATAGIAPAQDKMGGDMMQSGNMGMMTARQKNAQMLIRTLAEEKTEINQLTAQAARFMQMGGSENMKIARTWQRWVREHKAAGPGLMKLIRQNGGDPMMAKPLKAPVLGDKDTMIAATHKDHEAAVMTSQMRHSMTNSGAIMVAMHKRANLARKHLRQMTPFHDDMKMGGKMMGMGSGAKMQQAAMCPHCNVAMKGGKCPMCGMTTAQMKKMEKS